MDNRDGAFARSPIVIHPSPRLAAVRQGYRPSAALEIVPFLAVDHGEKFRRIDAVHFASHPAAPFDEPRVRPEIEQCPFDLARSEVDCATLEHRVE
jgi:hypothetical protein